jgi:hypothetical protein
MKYLRQFGRFWYDFVVGDDWRLAVGVVAIIVVVYVAAHRGLDAWWLLPAGVTALLWVSLKRASADRA